MIYVDTSVLVSALTSEPGTHAAQAWLWTQRPREIEISDWTLTEFSAALSIKARMGRLAPDERAATQAEFARVAALYFVSWEIGSGIFERAARLCERVESGLRASDALHVAIAEGKRRPSPRSTSGWRWRPRRWGYGRFGRFKVWFTAARDHGDARRGRAYLTISRPLARGARSAAGFFEDKGFQVRQGG